MTRLAPLFLTLLYLVAMVRPVFPILEFVVNQDYIAEFLCINTDKPELECNGKCYLMQMIKAQESEKQENLPQINLSEYPIGFVNIVVVPLKTIFKDRSVTPLFRADNYCYLYSFSDFHPPTFTV
ncbi:hypothetical protein Q4603_19275 [Zobellia galactanivorans]|nr:hypothetical protein [Zobellia galactanivorans]MBU3027564.1 hypothetical protein [Zobellia galactanivorans]MDO6810773.1 hypothetical protein [Zobellia galactanivorans]